MKTRLLIADDDRMSLTMLQGVIANAGYDVTTASDGTTAWEILEGDHPPTLAVLDWGMPGLEGIEICRRLSNRETLTPTYVILLTARGTKSDIVCGLQAGASDFITKPFDPLELLARVHVGERVTQLQATVQRLARYDSLTQILNRRALALEAEREWSRSLRSAEPLSCVMFDIDFFKKINDIYGHAVGDIVIARVAEALREDSRVNDVVARFGGEEFCALLPNTNESTAVMWAERLRQRIASLQFPENAGLRITASFGVSQRLQNTQGSTELIDDADQALLVAKQSGRNQVVGSSRVCGVNPNTRSEDWEIPQHVMAGEIMSPVLATLSSQTTLFEAAQFLLELRLDSAPVVDAEGNLIDILGEEELARKISNCKDWLMPLGDCITGKPASFDVHAPAAAVFKFLLRVSLRRLVIVDGTRPVGVVTRGTLLRWLCNIGSAKNEALPPGTQPSIGHHSDDQALRIALQRLQRQVGGIAEKVDAVAQVEREDLLVSVTQMQALCDDTIACVSRLCHTNYPHASLDACLG